MRFEALLVIERSSALLTTERRSLRMRFVLLVMNTQMRRQFVPLRKRFAAVSAFEVLHPMVRHIDVLAQFRSAHKRRLALITRKVSNVLVHPRDVFFEVRLSHEFASALRTLKELFVLLIMPSQLIFQRKAQLTVFAFEGLSRSVHAFDVTRQTAL